MRANVKENVEDYQGTIDDLTMAIKLIKLNANTTLDESNLYNNRAFAKSQLSDYHGAINDSTKAIELDPNNTSAYSIRAAAKLEIGDKEGAQADWARVGELTRKAS